MFKVRFTEIATGKITFPTVRNKREANYVYDHARRVATALFKVELLKGNKLVKEQMVGA